MKKIILCIMLLVASICPVNFIKTKADIESDYVVAANEVKQTIENDENINLDINSYHVLYDVELNPNYLLVDFSKGYAIVSLTNQIISEYNILTDKNPYIDYDANKLWVYGGPFNYLEVDEAMLYSKSSNPLGVSDELIKLNRNIVNSKSDLNNNIRTYNKWTGIVPGRFSRYDSGKWINSTSNYPSSSGYSEKGICGTISAAIMLAYLQDYVNADYVPSSIRTKGSESPEKLITTLYNYIDKGRNGTIPIEVCGGVNEYLTKYSYQSDGHRAGYGLTTFSTAQKSIDKGYPVCIGLLTMLGSNKGDHWVTAYQYIDKDGTTEDRYKCVSNVDKDDYAVVIYVSWTSGIVYIM